MYLKLFTFMTIFWCLEFVSHFKNWSIFVISDVLNCAQGIVIFIVFVLEKNIRKLIVTKFNSLRGKSEVLTRTDNDFEKNNG